MAVVCKETTLYRLLPFVCPFKNIDINILAFSIRMMHCFKITKSKKPPLAILKNIKIPQPMTPFLFYDVISDKAHCCLGFFLIKSHHMTMSMT